MWALDWLVRTCCLQELANPGNGNPSSVSKAPDIKAPENIDDYAKFLLKFEY